MAQVFRSNQDPVQNRLESAPIEDGQDVKLVLRIGNVFDGSYLMPMRKRSRTLPLN